MVDKQFKTNSSFTKTNNILPYIYIYVTLTSQQQGHIKMNHGVGLQLLSYFYQFFKKKFFK